MNEFEAYQTYLALKQHFSSHTYDYKKYNGKISAGHNSYAKRNDRHFFKKLANKKDPFNFLLANFLKSGYDIWIGEVIKNGDPPYMEWLKRKQSLSYQFKEELELLGDEFLPNLRVSEYKQPTLLKLYAQGKISLETLIIIDDLTGCFQHWDAELRDPVYWPKVHMLCDKYRTFFEYDEKKMKQILKEHFVGA